MTLVEELREAMNKHYPDAVCIGGVCYFPLDSRILIKAEFPSSGGNYNGLRLTVLNRRTGPVDSVTIHFWELPRGTKGTVSGCDGREAWDIYQPPPDIGALSEAAEAYFRLFREPDSEER